MLSRRDGPRPAEDVPSVYANVFFSVGICLKQAAFTADLQKYDQTENNFEFRLHCETEVAIMKTGLKGHVLRFACT